MKPISLEVPIQTKSTSNLREHHMARANRIASQRAATRRRLDREERPGPFLLVRLTRVAPRLLDDDNLRGALKGVRDAVAVWLAVDDRSCLVRWEYAQEQVSQKRGAPPVDCVRVVLLAVDAQLEALVALSPPGPVEPQLVPGKGEVLFASVDAPARPRRLSGPSLAALATPAYRGPKGGVR